MKTNGGFTRRKVCSLIPVLLLAVIVSLAAVPNSRKAKAAKTSKVAGYTVEYAIPWTGAASIRAGQVVGIDLQVNDCAAGKRNGTLNMFDMTGGAWKDTSLFGTAILVNDADDTVYPPDDRYGKAITAVFAKEGITVDGYVDAAWNSAKQYSLTWADAGSKDKQTTKADVKVMWDRAYLYVLFMVYDKDLDQSAANSYEADSTEVFLDEDYKRGGSYQADDLHYRVSYSNVRTVDQKSKSEQWLSGTSVFTNADIGQPDSDEGSDASIIRPSEASISSTVPYGTTSNWSWVNYGTMQKKYYYSSLTSSYRPCRVILPAGYSTAKKYPVVYLMHGIGGNEDFYGTGLTDSTVMRMAGNMMSTGECEEAIIVLPNIRVSTTPEYSVFSYENYKYYDLFREELTQCLMPYIQSQFSVKTGRENTAIAGFSMGGRESLYIGVTKVDTFGYVGAFCPTFGIFANANNGVYDPGLFTSQTFTLPQAYKNNTFLMIVKGTYDNIVKDQPAVYSGCLSGNGNEHIYYETAGAHDESVWSHGFYNFMKNVFR